MKKPSNIMFNYFAKPLKDGPSKELENRKENDKTETKNAHGGKEKKKSGDNKYNSKEIGGKSEVELTE